MKLKFAISYPALVFIMITACGSFPLASFGKDFEFEKTVFIKERASTIKEKLLDYPNMCKKGCTHYLSNVTKALIVDQPTPLSMITWIKASRDNYSNFCLVTVTEKNEEKTHFTIHSQLPTAPLIQELEKKFNLPHNSFFSQYRSKWDIQEIFDAAGEFQHSKVTYKSIATVEVNNFLINMFSFKIKDGIRKTAEEKIKILMEEKP